MCYKFQIVSNVDVCVGEGESCEGDKKCCDNLKCEKGKKKGADCDLAIAFDSDECGESSVNICKK